MTMGLTFKLHIHTHSMKAEIDVRKEIAACLRMVADAIERNDLSSPSLFHPNRIVDSTGHDCGRFFLKKELE